MINPMQHQDTVKISTGFSHKTKKSTHNDITPKAICSARPETRSKAFDPDGNPLAQG